jgi:hypothetical protein
LKQAVSDAALIVDEATDLARQGQNGGSLTQSANETSPSRAEAADLTGQGPNEDSTTQAANHAAPSGVENADLAGQGQDGDCEAPRNEPPSPFAFKESEVPQLDCEIKSVGSPSTSMIKVSDHGLLTQPAGEDSMSVDDSDDERVAHHDACHQTNWLTQPFDD